MRPQKLPNFAIWEGGKYKIGNVEWVAFLTTGSTAWVPSLLLTTQGKHSRLSKQEKDLNITLQGKKIKNVIEEKLLGVIIDNKPLLEIPDPKS